MPRIRSIKPDFFTSDTVSALPLRARLTWIGLWTHCDDYGRCRNNVKLVKAAVWPLDDVSLRDIEDDLTALAKAGVIYGYTGPDGKEYLQVTGWNEHQKVDRPSKSPIPAPEGGIVPVQPPDILATSSRGSREALDTAREDASNPRDRKGKERKGGEGTRERAKEPPPPKCPTHTDDPDPPPCGACGDRRRARDQWDRDQAAAAAEARQAEARARAEATRLAVEACRLCDDRGYLGTLPCAHDPDLANRTRARAAEVRAAIVVPLHRTPA